MNPENIPSEITDLMWTAPFVSISPTERINLTKPDTQAVLAHFWPAIEAHIRKQVAQEITAGLTAMHDDPTTAEQYHAGLRLALRNIHRLARA